MSNLLKDIYYGAIYLYSLLLIVVAMILVVTGAMEAMQGSYWQGLLSLLASGVAFGIVALSSQYLEE